MKAKITIRKLTIPAVSGALLALATMWPQMPVWAQTTAFTYQGRLNVGGSGANGLYDFTFQAFDDPTAGNSLGGTASVNGVGVTNGLFTAQVDLGASPFTGPARWLQLNVSTNGAGSYSTLSPRQPISPAPYSIFANTAGTVTNGGIGSAQLAANAVTTGNIQNSSVSAAKIASGQVVKSFNGLTDVVSLTPGPNVAINTIGNSLQISAGGFALPYSGSASSAGPIFTLTNSGTGPAAAFLSNVGIGRTNPPYALTVRGGSDPIAWERFVAGVQSGKTWAWEVDGAGTYLRNATDVSLPLTILNGGQVGIGTTAPQYALTVQAPSPSQDVIAWQNGSYQLGRLGWATDQNSGGIVLRTPSALTVDIRANGPSYFNGGNFGIGTANPQAPLHVVGANGNYGQLGTSESGVFGSAGFASLGTATAAVRGTNSYGGAYGELGRHDHFVDIDKSIGVFGSGQYAGWFNGYVFVNGDLGANKVAASELDVNANQGYALLWSHSSPNGSVLELRNDTASPTYLGAINFTTSGSAPGQIAYESDNALHFRTGGVDDRMKLNASGLYVNGTFVSSSDRSMKENFQTVDARQVLDKVTALPVTRWNYKQDTASEHIGPMAQDFYAAFKVGPDDKHITTIDESGVALVAIQGLNQKLEQKEMEITELKGRLEKLEQAINAKKGE